MKTTSPDGIERKCENCAFMATVTQGVGTHHQCRRNAPAPLVSQALGPGRSQAIWPEVNADMWCGDFAPSLWVGDFVPA